MKRIPAVTFLLAIIVAAVFTIPNAGCTSAGQLAWQPVAPGADPILVNAERADQAAFATVDAFVRWDDSNEAAVKATAPAAHEFAQTLRREAPAVFRELRAARATYKATRSSGDAATVEQKLGMVQAWASQARLFLAQFKDKPTTSPG